MMYLNSHLPSRSEITIIAVEMVPPEEIIVLSKEMEKEWNDSKSISSLMTISNSKVDEPPAENMISEGVGREASDESVMQIMMYILYQHNNANSVLISSSIS